MSTSITKSIGLAGLVQKIEVRRGTADIGLPYSVLTLDNDITLFLSNEALLQLGSLISAHMEGNYTDMYAEVKEPVSEDDELLEELIEDEEDGDALFVKEYGEPEWEDTELEEGWDNSEIEGQPLADFNYDETLNDDLMPF